MDRKLVGLNIRYLREQKDWTQDDLGEALRNKFGEPCKFTQGFVGHIERAERGTTLEVWTAIAEVLGVNLDTLTKTDLTQREQVTA